MEGRTKRAPRGFLAAGLGALAGGTGLYLIWALFNPMGITTVQYLTFDAKGELELDGVVILMAVFAVGITACIGAWIALWLLRYRFVFTTGLLMAPILFFGAMPIEEMHAEAAFFDTAGVYGWPLALAIWPYFAAVVARGVIVVLARERADRPADARSRLAEEWPQ